jgi:hypothetical protein
LFATCCQQSPPEPLPLDKDLQPAAPVPVLQKEGAVLEPNSEVTLPVWVRPRREGRTKVNLVLVYRTQCQSQGAEETARNLEVHTDMTLSLDCLPPFSLTFDVASPAPSTTLAPHVRRDRISRLASPMLCSLPSHAPRVLATTPVHDTGHHRNPSLNLGLPMLCSLRPRATTPSWRARRC